MKLAFTELFSKLITLSPGAGRKKISLVFGWEIAGEHLAWLAGVLEHVKEDYVRGEALELGVR